MDIHTRKTTIINRLGLHARPASRLAQLASRFKSDILLSKEDEEADAKSILEVLTLASPKGTELLIKAEGSDAADAVDALAELIDSGFGDIDG